MFSEFCNESKQIVISVDIKIYNDNTIKNFIEYIKFEFDKY